MANDVENTSSKVYRLLSDRCSLRVESAANPLRCCLSWRRACEVRRGGPAGRVRGHRMTGGTPKEVHWTAEQQKRPQRTYRGRKRRETAAQGLDHGRCFRPKMSCLSTPPKIRRLSYISRSRNIASCLEIQIGVGKDAATVETASRPRGVCSFSSSCTNNLRECS